MSLRAPAVVRWVAATAVAAGLVPVVAGQAAADPARRPVPAADSYRLLASGEYSLPVLDNDTVDGLFPGDLTLCGVDVDEAAQQSVFAEVDPADPTHVRVEVRPTAEGLVTFGYDACEGDQRRSSTVLLDITRLSSPRVTVPRGTRGQIAVTNPGDVRLTFQWGSTTEPVADGRRGVGPGRTVRIDVERRRVYWVAYVRDQGSIVVAGEGIVDGVRPARPRGG